MQRYFGKIEGNKAILDEESLHHFLNVMRGEKGERITVCFESKAYLCELASTNPVEISLIEEIGEDREMNNPLTIAFSLLKGDHNELIVLKCSEIGASAFMPFVSKRSIVKPKEKEDSKLLRLRKIAKEASSQCKRSVVAEVEAYKDFKEVLKCEYDYKLFAYEDDAGKSNSIFKALKGMKEGESVLLLIGPEGGFDPSEVEAAKKAGFTFVSLGKRILRAETAAIYGASLISSISEEE